MPQIGEQPEREVLVTSWKEFMEMSYALPEDNLTSQFLMTDVKPGQAASLVY